MHALPTFKSPYVPQDNLWQAWRNTTYLSFPAVVENNDYFTSLIPVFHFLLDHITFHVDKYSAQALVYIKNDVDSVGKMNGVLREVELESVTYIEWRF